MQQRIPAIHGHRGARGHRPENTLAGADFAIRAGCDAIEVDLQRLGDGNVVLYHDPVVTSRLASHACNGRNFAPLPLTDVGLEELGVFDVGKAHPESDVIIRFPDQQPVSGARIPSLDEFISFVADHAPAGVIINLELKSEGQASGDWIRQYVGRVMDSVNRFGFIERVFLQSFDWRLAAEARLQAPELLTGLLTDLQINGTPRIPLPGRPVHWTGGLDLADFAGSIPQMILAAGGKVWSSNHLDLTTSQVREAQALGLPVYCWTVNEASDMERIIAMGVDAIITDYPDRLTSLLGR